MRLIYYTDLDKLIQSVVKVRNYFEDMEQLIVTLHTFKSELLEELYDTLLESYLYKDFRLKYFGTLVI